MLDMNRKRLSIDLTNHEILNQYLLSNHKPRLSLKKMHTIHGTN